MAIWANDLLVSARRSLFGTARMVFATRVLSVCKSANSLAFARFRRKKGSLVIFVIVLICAVYTYLRWSARYFHGMRAAQTSVLSIPSLNARLSARRGKRAASPGQHR